MHAYRSHTCAALSTAHVGHTVRLSGWVHRVRDHGGILFIDLRDHHGITQVLADPDSPAFAEVERVRSEWVIRIDGVVKARAPELVNPRLATGEIEVRFISGIEVLSEAGELPLPVFGEQEYPEETRLRYRYLDLRRESLHPEHRLALASSRDLRRAWSNRASRVPDSDPDLQFPGRRARFPGAQPRASGRVLRPAAGPAAVQAAPDGVGLRPLFPDRPVLSRRGCPRRPLAGRVLPARCRNGLRHPGRCVQGDRAGPARGFEEFADWQGMGRTRPDGPFPHIPYAEAMASLRHRQA